MFRVNKQDPPELLLKVTQRPHASTSTNSRTKNVVVLVSKIAQRLGSIKLMEQGVGDVALLPWR